eukprot:6012548-Pyramimonas_sp.AAC.1
MKHCRRFLRCCVFPRPTLSLVLGKPGRALGKGAIYPTSLSCTCRANALGCYACPRHCWQPGTTCETENDRAK